MNSIVLFYRLLRPVNLILIALTPAAIWATLVQPLMKQPELTLGYAVSLGAMMACVAAAGNIVNDIADRTIDSLNKRPNPLLEGLPVSVAWLLAAGFAIVGLALSLSLKQYTGSWLYPSLTVGALSSLLLYAFVLKCTPVLGNLLVALLCAIVPGVLLVAEPIIGGAIDASPLAQTLVAYVAMAFFGTYAREVIKDLEDAPGDGAAGCNTLAVRWPRGRTILLAQFAMAGVLAAVAYVATIWYVTGELMNAVSWSALWLLLASVLYSISPVISREGLGQVSRHIKLSMAFGLFLLIIVNAGAWS